MFPLSYNTNGLRKMSLEKAIEVLARAEYDGVELSLHQSHLHPLQSNKDDLVRVRETFLNKNIKPICLATGADNLLSEERFEPSLVSADKEGRLRRIDLIKKSIEIAKFLSIPVVNFASGILKEGVSRDRARENLLEGIHACLKEAGEVILAIEPEPGFFVGTTTQAVSFIEEIDSPNFKLNMDIGHVNVSEDNFLEAVENAAPYTRHIHIEDIKRRIHHHEIPGEGDIDFEAVFQRLQKKGYRHYLSVELYHHADVWEKAIRQSRSYLLNKMESLT